MKNNGEVNNVKHPSAWIEPDLVDRLRHFAAEAEMMRQLHPAQLNIISQQQWFKLFVPKIYDGRQCALPEALRLEEALAWTDGSLGWTVTLCSGAAWFSGFFPPSLSNMLLYDHALCMAGSGEVGGIATKIPGGYRITGCWNHASGSPHATAFTANCKIEEEGVLIHHDGVPVVRPFLFLKEEVTVHDTWNAIGMIATASNRFEVRDVHIDECRRFHINATSAQLPDPLYAYPFRQFAEQTLAVNYSGMAMHFLDLCSEMTGTKPMRDILVNVKVQLENARAGFYELADRLWSTGLSINVTDEILTEVTAASKRLAHVSLQVVDRLFPCCGMHAIDPRTEINQVWRDLHTAAQHVLLNDWA